MPYSPGYPYAGAGDPYSPRPRGGSEELQFPAEGLSNAAGTADSGLGPYMSLLRSNSIGSASDVNNNPFPVPTLAPLKHRQLSIDTLPSNIGVADLETDTAGLSLDTFISYIQSIAGTEFDLDEDFVDKFVLDSGVLLVRFGLYVAVKIENRPQYMTLANECVLIRGGRVITARQAAMEKGGHLQRSDMKLRIVEVRDDNTTEPTIRLSVGAEESQQQQVYTRPGRKGGKKRGLTAEDEAALTPAQRLERLRADAEKDCLEQARDADEPVRYALLDPQCLQLLGEVHVLSSESALIEQLYSEIDSMDILRQVQALRALARAPPSTPLSIAINVAPPLRRAYPEALKLTALGDCLLGVHIRGTQSKVVSKGHSLYVRIEAAYAVSH